MDINLEELIGKPGRGKGDLGPVIIVRELTEADTQLVNRGRGPGTGLPFRLVKRHRERHHALARYLAEGKTAVEAAALTGYSLNHISILKSDPAMKDLINHYRKVLDAAYFDLHDRLKGFSVDAADVARDRLEEDPDSVSMGQLIEIIKMGADRTGHGPQSSQQINVNVDMAVKLEAARKRVARMREPKVIEGTAEEVKDDAA